MLRCHQGPLTNACGAAGLFPLVTRTCAQDQALPLFV